MKGLHIYKRLDIEFILIKGQKENIELRKVCFWEGKEVSIQRLPFF